MKKHKTLLNYAKQATDEDVFEDQLEKTLEECVKELKDIKLFEDFEYICEYCGYICDDDIMYNFRFGCGENNFNDIAYMTFDGLTYDGEKYYDREI